MKKSVARKENKTEQDKYMEKILGTSFDHSDKKYTRAFGILYERNSIERW